MAYTLSRLFWHVAAEIEALFVDPGAPLHWRKRELRSFGVRFGKVIYFGRHLHIHSPGRIQIGERATFGSHVQLMNFARINVGDDFLCAGNLVINTGNHDPETLVPGAAPVTIGKRVWCGTNVTILGGVTIGDDVVIGAGSLVIKSIPSNSIAGGVPARILRPLARPEGEKLWDWSNPHARSEPQKPA